MSESSSFVDGDRFSRSVRDNESNLVIFPLLSKTSLDMIEFTLYCSHRISNKKWFSNFDIIVFNNSNDTFLGFMGNLNILSTLNSVSKSLVRNSIASMDLHSFLVLENQLFLFHVDSHSKSHEKIGSKDDIV